VSRKSIWGKKVDEEKSGNLYWGLWVAEKGLNNLGNKRIGVAPIQGVKEFLKKKEKRVVVTTRRGKECLAAGKKRN